jgi:glycosyltransferase involved in cell wall biosynthesis
MIRFAIQWPEDLMMHRPPEGDYNGARQEFVRQFKPVLFMPRFKWRFTRARNHLKLLAQQWFIHPEEFDYAFSVGELNRKADVLIHFGQSPPQEFPKLEPPRGFRGLKVWHVFEYVFNAGTVNRMLEEGGVDYVLGYTDHGKYCAFFQKHYPRYVEKVLPYPFGTSQRFMVDAPWGGRKQKVIALGAVNLVNEPDVKESLREYAAFYANVKFTHQWRRMLVEHEAELAGVMDSQLPHFPEMKNPRYDAVKMMTSYALFANDEGLMAFPPARTYEGPAAGAAMISSDHGSYGDLGFRDGVNCVMHRKHDIADFRAKAEYWLQRPEDLRRVAEAGRKLIRTHYTHPAVAQRLKAQLETIAQTGKKPDTRLPENLIPA